MFNTRVYSNSLMITRAIWMELESENRKKINEARKRAKEKKFLPDIKMILQTK